MNKQDLINVVTTETGLDKRDVITTVEAVFEAIKNALTSGDKVSLHGFGSFEVRARAARSGVNPKLLKDLKEQGVDPETAKAKASIQIEASKAPAFKPATALKNAIK